MNSVRPVAVFGGTFNPVHYGHLRSALELLERLDLAELRLMPCAQPPHRDMPECSAKQRADMVELAVQGEPRLVCDRRELQRAGPSYTYDSLWALRTELGEARSLCLVMGCDSLLTLEQWHRWDELLQLCHMVVIARPGWELPKEGAVANWLQQHRSEETEPVAASANGKILIEELRPLSISSTEIRQLLAAGRSPRYLLPEPVLGYIEHNALYR